MLHELNNLNTSPLQGFCESDRLLIESVISSENEKIEKVNAILPILENEINPKSEGLGIYFQYKELERKLLCLKKDYLLHVVQSLYGKLSELYSIDESLLYSGDFTNKSTIDTHRFIAETLTRSNISTFAATGAKHLKMTFNEKFTINKPKGKGCFLELCKFDLLNKVDSHTEKAYILKILLNTLSLFEHGKIPFIEIYELMEDPYKKGAFAYYFNMFEVNKFIGCEKIVGISQEKNKCKIHFKGEKELNEFIVFLGF